jgi:prolyl oligopeptidase
LSEVDLPGVGSACGFGGEPDDAETFFSFESFNRPATIFRLNITSGEQTIFKQAAAPFDPDEYEVRQVFYPSKDGTRIPMFITHRKDTDLSRGAPTLLYGYGGFNVPLPPAFSVTRLQWMEMGGVLAVANLRGGGEYGKAWHDAGRLLKKQNTFDDFISAGEYLIAEGITTKTKLAIQGGSNGGLLAGAVVNQRPDLFAAALPAVGVMDMLRFNQFTAGRFWTDDYGDPAEEAHFRNLFSYSPYHNIQDGLDYPAIMVTTADTDDRVVPGHSFKYAAALQAANIGDKPHLIRIETRAGHGAGKPTGKIIEEYGDMWAFAAHWTGLKPPAE